MPAPADSSTISRSPLAGASGLSAPMAIGCLVNRADQGWELFETGTWESRIVFGNAASAGAFSPDSATFAYETYYETQGGRSPWSR